MNIYKFIGIDFSSSVKDISSILAQYFYRSSQKVLWFEIKKGFITPEHTSLVPWLFKRQFRPEE